MSERSEGAEAVVAEAVAADPFARFAAWFAEATASEPDAEAAALATVDGSGAPSVRMVLVKGHGADGFVFYTNLGSRKGRDLRTNPRAALCFHWKSLRRQVRVEGGVEPVDDALADAYFASRPRESRIGAWASRQSEPLDGPLALEREVVRYAQRYPLGEVPRPPFWGGFRIVPTRIELWQDAAFRLHRRWEHLPTPDGWTVRQLFP